MLNVSRDIDSLSHFKKNTPECLKRLHDTGEPLVLTVNGKPEAVVLAPQSYDRLAKLADQMELIEALKTGLQDVDEGRTLPLADVFEALRQKYDV